MQDPISLLGSTFAVAGIAVVGVTLSFVVIGLCTRTPKPEEEEERFEDRFLDEWDEMEDIEPSPEELASLVTSYRSVETPQGEVVVCYNKDEEAFDYWSDTKSSIRYPILEAVAREYSVTKGYKRIFIDMEEEVELARAKLEEEKVKEEEAKKAAEEEESKKDGAAEGGDEKQKSVFANFKSYNKGSTPGTAAAGSGQTNSDKKSSGPIPERANRYRCRGSIADWKALVEPAPEPAPEKTVTFSAFKKMEKEKKKHK